jgi:hypothetical protein
MISPDLDIKTSLTRSTLSSLVPLALYQTLDQFERYSTSLPAKLLHLQDMWFLKEEKRVSNYNHHSI